jgi:hypothetical protein
MSNISAISDISESLSGQTIDYYIDICRFFAKHSTVRNRNTEIMVMCLSEATCLLMEWCFNESGTNVYNKTETQAQNNVLDTMETTTKNINKT